MIAAIARALGFASLLALTSAAFAQTATPPRVRGTIEVVSATELKVASREGPMVALRLADNLRVVAVAKAALSDIKSGTYIGTAAMPRPDGSLMALEVLIFPEAMRGAGEGHRPWDLMPESTMTNATVAETVGRVEGQTLTLTYKEGQKTVVVPPEAPIVTFAPATRADLKPGARVMVSVTQSGSEPVTATSIVVGRDGVDPPM